MSPNYWNQPVYKAPKVTTESYTATPKNFTYEGQTVVLFRQCEDYDVTGQNYINGTPVLSVAAARFLYITAIHFSIEDLTAPAPIGSRVKLGASDNDILFSVYSNDGNVHHTQISFSAPYPVLRGGDALRLFHISGVGAPTYRVTLCLYGFYITAGVGEA